MRDDVPNETQRSIALRFDVPGQDELLAPYVERYLEAAETIWEEQGHPARDRRCWSSCSRGRWPPRRPLDRVDAWLADVAGQPGGAALRARGRDDLARAPLAAAGARHAGQPRPHPEACGASSTPAATRCGVQLRAAGVLGEHADATDDAADQVAGGERASASSSDGQPDLRVARASRRASAPVTTSSSPAAGSTSTSTERAGATSAACSRSANGAGLALRRADVHRELEAAERLGVADRLVDLVALRGGEGVTSGHWCHRPVGALARPRRRSAASAASTPLRGTAEPLGLAAPGLAGLVALAAHHRRQVDQQRDQHEQAERDHREDQQRVQRRHARGCSPSCRGRRRQRCRRRPSRARAGGREPGARAARRTAGVGRWVTPTG